MINAESWSSVLDPSEIRLEERIDQAMPGVLELPTISDKWILSSALQKLIRRCRPNEAISVGMKLHQLDPAYLPRRLPIIAIEDIGLGDLAVCRDVLLTCSATRWWRTDASRTIAFLVGSMADAVKSRSACDALCLAESHRDAKELMPGLLLASSSQLTDIAADRNASRIKRMNALRLLGGVTIRQGARYVPVSRCDHTALVVVAEALNLPPLVRWLMSQNRKTGNLASMLPFAVEAATDRTVKSGADFPHSLELSEGVPLCALDMFSECGRGVLREFFLASKEFSAFASRHVRAHGGLRLFNMALFHAESSILGRYLSSVGLDQLTTDVEREEMHHLGMVDVSRRAELRALILAEAPRLAAIRRRRLALVEAKSVISAEERVAHYG